MEQIQFAVVDTLLRIAFASSGCWLCGKAGRYFAEFKDKRAALFLGVGLLLVVMACKSL